MFMTRPSSSKLGRQASVSEIWKERGALKRERIQTFVVAVAFLLPLTAPSQGTTYISNLDQTPTGSLAVGSDSWLAPGFYLSVSDPNTYSLDSIQLLITPASGSPGGFSVSIYSTPWGSTGGPQSHLGDLDGSSDPSIGGIYTYTATGITISSSDAYFVVVTAATPTTEGAYHWSVVEGGTANGTWSIANGYATSSDGLTWVGHPRQGAMQLAITATLIPEPTTGSLLGFGLAALCLWRHRPRCAPESQRK